MGRFLSRDPIGTADDINLYRYVKNSPLMYTDPDGKIAKRFLMNGWNGYMNWSDKNGEWMFQNFHEYEGDIVGTIDRVRRYSGNVGLAAMPFLFFPPTTPAAAGIIGVTGGMSFGAGTLESYVTQDKSYFLNEGGSFVMSKLGGTALQEAGIIPNVTFSTSASRYMGYSSNGTYGFLTNKTGQAGLAISQTTEQLIGWITQKITP